MGVWKDDVSARMAVQMSCRSRVAAIVLEMEVLFVIAIVGCQHRSSRA